MIITPQLVESLKRHEGFRHQAYQDTEGVWTIGYGTNLQELWIDQQQALQWLMRDAERAAAEARSLAEWSALGNKARQDVVIEMVYNLGLPRYLGFRKARAAIMARDYREAAAEMLDSRWHRQVGERARRLARQMRTGQYPDSLADLPWHDIAPGSESEQG